MQFGIAGSFPDHFEIGEVIEVGTEIYGELGAESADGFQDLRSMGFQNFTVNDDLYYNEIHNPAKQINGIKRARSITVNRVHGKEESIREISSIWNPEIESMEGAAFFQACLMNKIPFREFRAISNIVEPRNRDAWNIPLALNNLHRCLLTLLENKELHL